MKRKTVANEAESAGISMDEPIMTTGVVSGILHMPLWVLKQLDKHKIVSPKRRKGMGRLYSQREFNKLKHIWYLMKVRRVKVDGIKVILEMEAKGYKTV
ncbi:MAG: MerR family transcriptional regulator [Candidatus Omnitrophica bacterium]|nr:MerR family transcriptional regulator [Candidatus Omnitrophota bacterium]MCM8791447.1 MerR family transcriptional regulator [Candidatus Omnitrophota bacterium]